MFVATLCRAAGFQKSPWCDFVLGQFLLYPSTPVQGSGRGMEIVPVGNYNAEESPKHVLFTTIVQDVEVSD